MSKPENASKVSVKSSEENSFAKITADLAKELNLVRGWIKKNSRNENTQSTWMRSENRQSMIRLTKAEYGWSYSAESNHSDSRVALINTFELTLKVSKAVDCLPGWRESKAEVPAFKLVQHNDIQKNIRKELKSAKDSLRYEMSKEKNNEGEE
jgi:hypothetical protein